MCTLSIGVALTSWIEPDLTTVRQALGVPAGTGGDRGRRADRAGRPAAAARRSTPRAACHRPPPGLAGRLGGLAALEQVRGDLARTRIGRRGCRRRRLGRGGALGGRGVAAGGLRRGLRLGLFGPLAEVFGDLGHWRSLNRGLTAAH